MTYRLHQAPHPPSQRGSVLVNVAAGLSLMVILLSIIDLGFIYFHKREYQRAADLGALAGAQAVGNAAAAGIAESIANNNLQVRFPNASASGPPPTCGTWSPGPPISFVPTSCEDANAVEVIVKGRAPRFLPFIGDLQIGASAIAMAGEPQAQLKIRSTVATLEDGAVNTLLSSLLGGDAALNVVGWQGVANADVNLLQFFNNILGVDIDADIGTYESLLESTASVGEILSATVAAVGPSSAAGVALSTFEEQLDLVGVDVDSLSVPLGNLIALQAGAETASLDAVVNAFDLVRAVAEIANDQNAIAATVPISVPGVAGISIRASVIERPQPSVIGNPKLIGADPRNGPNRIFVRTAQVRVLVSVDLTAVGLVNGLMNILGPLLSVTVLDDNLSIALQLGGAEGWVTGHNCGVDGGKTLTAESETAVANASIGRLTPAQEAAVFDSGAGFPAASSINVLRLSLNVILVGSVPVAEVRLAASNLPVGGSSKAFPYTATPANPNGLPNIDVQPEPEEMFQSLSTQDAGSSLTNAIDSLDLRVVILNSALLGGLLNGVLGPVSNLVGSVLRPLLDPISNNLLAALGLNLAKADLGAKLTCRGGEATLVE